MCDLHELERELEIIERAIDNELYNVLEFSTVDLEALERLATDNA